MITRFKKGSMVEFFCQTGNPAGSWRWAEIVGRNGHEFIVNYFSVIDKEMIEERVPRKFIRPSPPKVDFEKNWKPGDVFEVFHNFAWKMATLSKMLSRGKFLVRLVGFCDEFEVSKSDIRLRQSWEDGKWFVIGKNVMNNVKTRSRKELLKHNQISGSQIRRTIIKINLKQKRGHVMYTNNINLQSSTRPSTIMLKRKSPNYLSQAESCRKKFREDEKDGSHYPVYFENVSQLPEKVKGNTFDRDVLDKNTLPLSPNGRIRNLSGANKRRLKGDVRRFLPSVSSGWKDNNDDAYSTGCSSVCSNDPFNLRHTTNEQPVEMEKDYCSDAESSCWSHNEERIGSSITEEEMGAKIHRLELHAYRCTMKEFYASGPLTWEHESLMTNLRILLRISHDEHLMELRTLISNSRNSAY